MYSITVSLVITTSTVDAGHRIHSRQLPAFMVRACSESNATTIAMGIVDAMGDLVANKHNVVPFITAVAL